MDQKQDYREKYEKGKLHTRYLFIIAGILAVIGISIALGGDSEALGQISMASTVSSIILSSIAIFMSISGENKLNYTQSTLLETSERLSNISVDIEKANSKLDNTINQKFMKIDDIFDRLEHIGQSVDNVEKEMLNRNLRANEDSAVKISNDILWQLYNDMIEESPDDIKKIIQGIVEYCVVCNSENASFRVDNIEKYLQSVLGFFSSFFDGYVVGIIKIFMNIGITSAANAKYFKEKMNISQAKWNEIKEFI